MNPPPDKPDRLAHCLAGEVADLPKRAAHEARAARARSLGRRRLLFRGAVVAALGLFGWQALSLLHLDRERKHAALTAAVSPAAPETRRPIEFVRLHGPQMATADPVAVPAGTSKEYQALLEAARGQPVLLVLDSSGKLASVHVFER